MSDLTDFLLARIAEDEEVAREQDIVLHGYDVDDSRLYKSEGRMVLAYPARVLAECEAKRAVMEAEPDCGFDRFQRVAWDDCHEMALRAIALPYADHPDYPKH